MARLIDLIRTIDDKRRDRVERIYRDHEDLFTNSPGSSFNHQAWPGGLADHLADMFRIARLEYPMLNTFLQTRGEKLPFTLGSAEVTIFCHDAEKVVVYGHPHDPRCSRFIAEHGVRASEKATKEDIKWHVIEYWEEAYGFELSDQELNAVRYTHGEGDHYRNDRRVMGPLAAFVGNIDRTSARILYDSGRGLGSTA